MRAVLTLSFAVVLAGCALPVIAPFSPTPDLAPRATAEPAVAVGEPDPTLAPLPKPAAMTAEALDTTSEAEKAAATAKPVASGKPMGRTIASLGDPTDTGFWLKTPLVTAPQEGRVETAEGRSVKVGLFPLTGGAKAGKGGSQISLPAMRALGLDLTAMPELTVYRD